jgi:hypothetical protein
MECGLATAHCFDEVGTAIGAEVFLLFNGHIANFTTAACVYRLEFSSYDMWCGSRLAGWRFRGEEARHEVFLKKRSALVRDGACEVDMAEDGVPQWARHDCYRSLYIVAEV